MKVLRLADVKGVEIVPGAVRKVLVYSDNMMMVYNEAPPGGKLSHSHPHEQMGYVVKGKAKLNASGEEVLLEVGDSYFLESNEHHEFEVVGDESAIILDIFNPPREDYISSD
jgi:quercetin dioxygenase-like cupin family protein